MALESPGIAEARFEGEAEQSGARLRTAAAATTPTSPVRALAEPWLAPVARACVRLGWSANAVTAISLGLGGLAALALGAGRFDLAVAPLALSCLGDALDGAVARQRGTASTSGALFDASADRYQELLVLGALAVLFRSSPVELGLALAAIGGSFMISYGSAKAEAAGVVVPGGGLRRGARAAWTIAGVALVALLGALGWTPPDWLGGERAPIVIVLAIFAFAGNASAILRIRRIAALREGEKAHPR